MAEDAEWLRALEEAPLVRAALDRIGARAQQARRRTRLYANRLRTSGLDPIEIFVRLQAVAAGKERRAGIVSALPIADRTREAARSVAPRPTARTSSRDFRRARIWPTVTLMVLAISGPALLLPRRVGGGFPSSIDQALPWAGGIALMAAALWTLHARRAARVGAGSAAAVVLALWSALGVVVALRREPDLSDPPMAFGLVGLGAAVVLYAVIVILLAARRSSREPAPPDDDELREEEMLATVEHAVRGESEAEEMHRRAAYGEGVRVLLRRGAVDGEHARLLLRYGDR